MYVHQKKCNECAAEGGTDCRGVSYAGLIPPYVRPKCRRHGGISLIHDTTRQSVPMIGQFYYRSAINLCEYKIMRIGQFWRFKNFMRF